MTNKLFVGNLPFDTSEGLLKELCEQLGEVVSVKIITDRDTGESKGFGFVEMRDEDAAQNVIKVMNGSEIGGRKITVNVARERQT